MSDFCLTEKHLSQIPALQLLVAMGFEYLTPAEALDQRLGKKSNVLLEGILRNQIKEINRIRYKGSEYLFSEENVQTAVQKLKNLKYDGLLKTNEDIYDLITLGAAMVQTIEGDTKSFNLEYVDWRNPERNRFHVTVEYSVERTRSTETVRPDIVLFVNGIPFCVIECKAPQVEIKQAVSQSIRNQTDSFIPRLFVYCQMVLATNKNSATYATVGTSAKFWAVWKEPLLEPGESEHERLQALVNAPQPQDVTDRIASTFGTSPAAVMHDRLVTEQDKTIFALCRPDRLLELAWKFTIFDKGVKKIARYQQFHVIKSTMARVKLIENSDDGKPGPRKGGIIWHTQGSGKSLTMVMLARNLALDPDIVNPRIVLVTDRDDLDRQLGNTFAACGLDANRATSGRNLLDLVSEKNAGIITTLVQKFDKALSAKNFCDDSPDIFILVDESHRTQFGLLSAKMRQMFPRACYLGFTGTPLLKRDKNSFSKFGGLLQPYYSIQQAVEDKAVVPLLYEGRMVEMIQDQSAVDLWFERHTQGLSEDQKADLKRKYARAEMLNKADKVIYMTAWDISEHFRSNWQGTGFKAQLVAPNKVSALRYNQYLEEIGNVSSEVVMSEPDPREGFSDTDEETNDEVVKFWQKMMNRHGNEAAYNANIISQFKNGDSPEILIVVDKLLTGFDAPRNTVLYLCRKLKEHSLLQAIARVNRLYENKEFGLIVDYANVLGNLDQALCSYAEFEGFDESDLAGTLTSIDSEIGRLPRLHSELWDIFRTVRHIYDEEAYEKLLADRELRDDFYERLSRFGKCLGLALSSEKFLSETEIETVSKYRRDLRRFELLRISVRTRYADAVNFREYEPRIKKLLDTHIQADRVFQLNQPIDIFDEDSFGQIKEARGVHESRTTPASKADIIAHETKRAITERMDQDPVFYEKFSRLIQQVIDDFRAQRLSDLEYLNKALEIRNKVVGKVHDDVPDRLSGNENAMAYFGVLMQQLNSKAADVGVIESAAVDTALAVDRILRESRKVDFWADEDAQKRAANEIDDFLYDELKTGRNINLTIEQMDGIIESVLRVARHRGS